MRLAGEWYRSGSSAKQPAQLDVTAAGHVVVLDANGRQLAGAEFSELDLSERIGNTPRFIAFADGARFETRANDEVDQLVTTYMGQTRSALIHQLESHKRFILLALIVVITFVYSMVTWGFPAAARVLAPSVPTEVVRFVSRETLAVLDKAHFKPSQLERAVTARVLRRFTPVIADHPQLKIKVLFRNSEQIGANAFALPDGTVVFTDAMVEAAEHDDELVAVLAHEIGHVLYYHSMRRLIQDSMLGFLATVIVGDISGTSEIFLGLPVLLTELAYTRDFEREADDYALSYLKSHDLDPAHFVHLMARIEELRRCPPQETECEQKARAGWLGYLATHPATSERLEKFR